MADGENAVEAGERAVVEHGGHEPLVLDDGDVGPIADGHPGRLLPAVLQGEQTQISQMRDGLARGIDPEDAARFLGGVVVQGRIVVRLTGGHVTSLPGRAEVAATSPIRRRGRAPRGARRARPSSRR